MVRTETSSSPASDSALIRPRVCSSIMIDKSRLARIFWSLAQNTDNRCQPLSRMLSAHQTNCCPARQSKVGKEGKNGPLIPLFDPPGPATRLPRRAAVLGPRPPRTLRSTARPSQGQGLALQTPGRASSSEAAEGAMSLQWIASDIQTPIVELRRYQLRPGRFGDFIELFEARFIEQQEAV